MQHFAPAAAADDARDNEDARTARVFEAAFLAKCLKVGGFFNGGGDDDEVLVVGALEHLGWILAAEFAFPLDTGTPRRISWHLWNLCKTSFQITG